jgi:hypothetical protein
MKFNISNILFYFILLKITKCLYFEIKGDRERCFVDEFFDHSVMKIILN